MKYLLIFSLFFAVVTPAIAQVTPPSKPIDVDPVADRSTILVVKPSTIVLSSDKDYLIGHNDVLAIKIEDAPELTGKFQLNSKGGLTLAVIGNIEAEGKTIEEITAIITSRLKNGYLINPIVSVRVEQSNTRAFFIQGAVLRPGTYQIQGNVSLLKLITIAGGLTTEHGPNAIVMREKRLLRDKNRQGTLNQEHEIIKINIRELYNVGLGKDVIVRPGDIVNIPHAEKFFIGGEVRNPGSFPIKENMTLLQAIALAGGLSEKAGSMIILTRKKGRGAVQKTYKPWTETKTIEIDLDKLIRGGTKNLILNPRDVIYIAKSSTK